MIKDQLWIRSGPAIEGPGSTDLQEEDDAGGEILVAQLT
jgi:hypothetical protein